MADNHVSSARIAVDIGILVVDMERSLHFYRDILGMPVTGEVRTSMIGAGRLVKIEYGSSLIKLLQMDDAPTNYSPSGLTSAYGLRYITLLVDDIEQTVTRIEQSGQTITMPVTILGHGVKIAMVEDPDGNVIEFVQEA